MKKARPKVLPRLYRTPWPEIGESAVSWLCRCATVHSVSLAQVMKVIFRTPKTIRDPDIYYELHNLGEVAAVCLVPPDILAPVSALARTILRLEEYRWMTWNLAIEKPIFRYCPVCLGESHPAFLRMEWRLASSVVCLQHQIMLHDHCWNCRSTINWLKRPGHKMRAHHQVVMRLCPRCGKNLALAPKVQISEVRLRVAIRRQEVFTKAAFSGVLRHAKYGTVSSGHLFQSCLSGGHNDPPYFDLSSAYGFSSVCDEEFKALDTWHYIRRLGGASQRPFYRMKSNDLPRNVVRTRHAKLKNSYVP